MVCTNILNTLKIVFANGYVTPGSLQLTPEVVYSCTGERVTFSCVVTTGGEFYWEVDHVNLADSGKCRFLATDQPGRTTIYIINGTLSMVHYLFHYLYIVNNYETSAR